ncbi:MAG: peptidase [Dehalococcoidia bacterium]
MKSEEGLLAIADTRITSGMEASTAKKISVHEVPGGAMFIASSGLRSVRDKTLTYFEEETAARGTEMKRLYQAANVLAEQIRRVRKEDGEWLDQSGLTFDIHCILGGQLEEDAAHRLYHIYPEGNWVEVGSGTPYIIIGESSYGKALLDRVWRHDRPLLEALTSGLLSFDATRISAADVDPPVDVVLYRSGAFQMHEQRFDAGALRPLSIYWNNAMTEAAARAEPIVAKMFARLEAAPRSGRSDIPGAAGGR